LDRSTRLLALLDALRRRRGVVTAARLAEDTGVSPRTLYRDIRALRELGAPVEGEAGVGYVMRPGFFLPPLMFSREEIEALVLGARWVETQPDAPLAQSAKNALGKIAAAAPPDLRARIDDVGLWPIFFPAPGRPAGFLSVVREAMSSERTLSLSYADAKDRVTERRVWPVHIGFHEDRQTLDGWCLLRQAFRSFRADRIRSAEVLSQPYGRTRRALAGEWEKLMRETSPAWYRRLENPQGS
jgi:predicted DNA-binding transcriptional regulator YafY